MAFPEDALEEVLDLISPVLGSIFSLSDYLDSSKMFVAVLVLSLLEGSSIIVALHDALSFAISFFNFLSAAGELVLVLAVYGTILTLFSGFLTFILKITNY